MLKHDDASFHTVVHSSTATFLMQKSMRYTERKRQMYEMLKSTLSGFAIETFKLSTLSDWDVLRYLIRSLCKNYSNQQSVNGREVYCWRSTKTKRWPAFHLPDYQCYKRAKLNEAYLNNRPQTEKKQHLVIFRSSNMCLRSSTILAWYCFIFRSLQSHFRANISKAIENDLELYFNSKGIISKIYWIVEKEEGIYKASR